MNSIENQKKQRHQQRAKIFNSIESFYRTSNTSRICSCQETLQKENWSHENKCSDFQREHLTGNKNKAVEPEISLVAMG